MPYINTEHLFKCETCKNHNKSGCAVWCDHGEQYIPDIKKIPEADVEEVVRCKDCKHWGGVTFGYICRRFSGSYIRNETRENDFCSYGERRDT